MKVKLKFSFDVIIIAFALIIPMVGYLNLTLKGFTTSWGLIFVYFIYISKVNPKILFRKSKIKGEFAFLVIFTLIIFFNFLLIDLNPKSQQYFYTFVFFILLYFLDSLFKNDLNKKVTIVFLIFLALGLQAIVSIPYILSSDFLLIRNLSSGQLSQQATNEALKNGVGTNALYTSLSSLAIFGLMFQKKLNNIFARIIMLICVLCIAFSIVISTFFTSIFMLFLGILLLIILSFRKFITFKNIFYFFIALLIANIIFDTFISDTRLLEPILVKIDKLESQDGDITGRSELAAVSLNTFYDNPFLGIGVPKAQSYDKIGEHTPWVDFLANFGLIGIFPLLLFIYLRIKNRFKGILLQSPLNLSCLIGVCIFLLSNFISPMIITPITYISFIFIYTSESFKEMRYFENRSNN